MRGGERPGTVNKLAADQAPPFGGLASSALASGQWPSPACAVQETFSAWPANYTPVAYDTSAADPPTSPPPTARPASPTSCSAARRPRRPPGRWRRRPAARSRQAPRPAGTNAAAPGVQQATAGDPVNTENGDFTQSSTDLSDPGVRARPELHPDLRRATATQQTRSRDTRADGIRLDRQLGVRRSPLTSPRPVTSTRWMAWPPTPGTAARPRPGALNGPTDLYRNGGNLYFADTAGQPDRGGAGGVRNPVGHLDDGRATCTRSRATTHGVQGDSPNGTPVSRSLLAQPCWVTVD